MAEFPRHPFLLTVQETEEALGTNVDRGLTPEQVADLQARHPKNELDVGGTIPWYSILAKQILNAMIIVRCRLSSLYYYISVTDIIMSRSSSLPWP